MSGVWPRRPRKGMKTPPSIPVRGKKGAVPIPGFTNGLQMLGGSDDQECAEDEGPVEGAAEGIGVQAVSGGIDG